MRNMQRFTRIDPNISFGKTFNTIIKNVGTSATLIINTARPMAYLIKNANPSVAADIVETSVLDIALRSGTTVTTPIDVSGYKFAYVYVQITGSSGGNTLDVNIVERAPFLAGFSLTQPIMPGLNGTVASNFAMITRPEVTRFLEFSISVIGGGDFTYGVDVVLKEPSTEFIRDAVGTQAIFLGNAGVTLSSGYILVPGEEKILGMAENTKLFAVCNPISPATTLPVHILEMGI